VNLTEMFGQPDGLKFEADLREGTKRPVPGSAGKYEAVSHFAKGGQDAGLLQFLGGFGCTPRARVRRTSIYWTKAPRPSKLATECTANGLADKCSFETVNVFDWLRRDGRETP